MIRYALKCSAGHPFESWFQSARAFDTLHAAGHVSCPECGSARVEKALMAPQVKASQEAGGDTAAAAPDAHPGNGPATEEGPLGAPHDPRQAALAELRRRVEASSDYVGLGFAAEARRMHLGESPERSIYGEARIEEAKALLDEGVPVTPLPFVPPRRAN